MSGHGEKLTRKQEQAISALLAKPTIAEAAAATGLADSTLRRWLQAPAFCAAYRQARRDLVEAAIGRLQQAAGKAVTALVSIIDDDEAKNADVVRAAKTILDQALRGVELLDLEGRIEALEAAAAAQQESRKR